MTKKERFNLIASVNSDNAEIVEFCNKEIALLEARKNHKTPTKTQKANEEVKAVITEVLIGSESPMTVSDLIADERLSSYSSQKVSALLRQMKEDGKVIKIMKKKKALFSVA